MTLTIVVAATLFGLLVVKAKASEWGYAVASAYSVASTGSRQQGCAHAPPLRDSALSVATFLVGCGKRLRICYGSRCVVATRWDSGPFVAGRQIDVTLGVARALGFSSASSWGVRAVRWTPPGALTSQRSAAWLTGSWLSFPDTRSKRRRLPPPGVSPTPSFGDLPFALGFRRRHAGPRREPISHRGALVARLVQKPGLRSTYQQ